MIHYRVAGAESSQPTNKPPLLLLLWRSHLSSSSSSFSSSSPPPSSPPPLPSLLLGYPSPFFLALKNQCSVYTVRGEHLQLHQHCTAPGPIPDLKTMAATTPQSHSTGLLTPCFSLPPTHPLPLLPSSTLSLPPIHRGDALKMQVTRWGTQKLMATEDVHIHNYVDTGRLDVLMVEASAPRAIIAIKFSLRPSQHLASVCISETAASAAASSRFKVRPTHARDLTSLLVATLAGAQRSRATAGSGWPGVSRL